MRTEQEMFDLILNVAKADDRVRAVYMNGSRTNPNVKKDKYRDYDIVFVVKETQSFLENRGWIKIFGELAIVQEPDSNDFAWGLDHDFSRSYMWLMLFKDGNRIDLGIKTEEYAMSDYLTDTLCVKLLDKDNILVDINQSNDSVHWIKKPSNEQYKGSCNEFWWCLNNVAKGIAREQMSYAQRMYIEVVHAHLEKMIEWYIASKHNFLVTTGMWGKYFGEYLTAKEYRQYLKTYANGDYEDLWNAVFTACDLFKTIAIEVSQNCGFDYNMQDGENTVDYLKNVRYDRL